MQLPQAKLFSPRLCVRRLTRDDLEMLVRLRSDPEVARFVGGVQPRADTEDMMQGRVLEYYERFPGLGIWATEERASGCCIGIHLLNHIRGESDLIQLGYSLFPEFWGQGYATEMGRRLLRYGFTQLALPRIVAITNLPHFASQRVLVKCGLHRRGERTFEHPSYGGEPLAWFERDAAAWLAEEASGRTRGTPP